MDKLSLSGKRWIAPKVDAEASLRFQQELEVSRIAGDLLVQQGFTDAETAYRFLNPSLDELGAPNLLPDYNVAVDEIMAARERGDLIFIHGDYDVDGVTSAAILDRFLKKIGCKVHTHVPHRIKEGYGINMSLVHEAKIRNTGLFLTCDCGISAHNQIDAAREAGMRVVVTDHHSLQETMPNAHAVVNPHRTDSRYPHSELSGAGVVFRLCEGIAGEIDPGSVPSFRKNFLDLAALGTIVDVMPLTGDNRIIAKYGLERLSESKKKGIVALKSVSDVKDVVTMYDVGFRLGPRLNAAGRIDDATLSLRLLLAEDETEAMDLAMELDRHNTDRRAYQDRIAEEAINAVNALPELPPILLMFDSEWHPGVVGIVAGKLRERFNRPAFVGCIDPETGRGKASGRSIPGLNLATLIQNYPALVSGGGHAMAAGIGFDADQLQLIRRAFEQYVLQTVRPDDLIPSIEISAELENEIIDFEFLAQLSKFEPYGMANPKPIFCACGVKIESIRPMGAGGTHARLTLSNSNHRMVQAVAFGQYELLCNLSGQIADIAFEPQINEYNGTKSVQWRILDVRQ